MIQKMESNPPAPPPEEDIEDEQELDEGDAVEIIELDEDDGLVEGVDDIGLDGLNDEDGDLNGQGIEENDNENNDYMEIEDDSKLSFQKHNGSVFSISLNPADQKMAISGIYFACMSQLLPTHKPPLYKSSSTPIC